MKKSGVAECPLSFGCPYWFYVGLQTRLHNGRNFSIGRSQPLYTSVCDNQDVSLNGNMPDMLLGCTVLAYEVVLWACRSVSRIGCDLALLVLE